MQKSAKIALIAVFVIVIGGGFGFYFFVLRDDAPERAGTNFTSGVTVAPGATAPASADGTWKVDGTNVSTFAGYRMQDLFGPDRREAAGRTSNVMGSISVKGTTVDPTEITVDMTTLQSAAPPRDNAIRTQGLETNTYKTSSFKVTAPITLPSKPVVGAEQSVTVKGDLTLHGVTKPAEVTLKATWEGPDIKVSGSAPVRLADFGITKLQLGPVTIDDHGDLEFQLVMIPA